jgi:DNA-directed RNA polymerase subunit RPC12/RpoP
MANILGKTNGGQTPQPPKIDLKDAKEIACQECGGTVFIEGTKFLKISKILTGQPQDAVMPIPLYLCGDCGEICQELLPKELQK